MWWGLGEGPFANAFSKNRLIETPSSALTDLGQEVSVAVHCGLYRGMAQLVLYELDILPLGNQQRSVGMPKVMKPYPPQTSAAQRGMELPPDQISRIQGLACTIGENQVIPDSPCV